MRKKFLIYLGLRHPQNLPNRKRRRSNRHSRDGRRAMVASGRVMVLPRKPGISMRWRSRIWLSGSRVTRTYGSGAPETTIRKRTRGRGRLQRLGCLTNISHIGGKISKIGMLSSARRRVARQLKCWPTGTSGSWRTLPSTKVSICHYLYFKSL